jgi:hypothetical protein
MVDILSCERRGALMDLPCEREFLRNQRNGCSDERTRVAFAPHRYCACAPLQKYRDDNSVGVHNSHALPVPSAFRALPNPTSLKNIS